MATDLTTLEALTPEAPMPDDLPTRCLAEVERAMADEKHSRGCFVVRDCGGAIDLNCSCDRDQRLASRLARMLAAGMDELVGWAPMSQPGKDHAIDRALRAVARAREAP